MTRPHYDDLDDAAQSKVNRAIASFLRDGGHRSLREAVETLGMEKQELFSMIMSEAGLPDCAASFMIQTGWNQ